VTLYRTMADLATESLREGLLVGRYSPGTRLIPSELEETLNLGRMAIREALKELIGSGLVIQKANKGICVAAPPSIFELDALFDARCALEGKVAVMAAANLNEGTIGELERLYEEMKDPGKPTVEYFLLNRKFHLTLYKASGWAHAVGCIINLLDQVISCFALSASRLTLDFKPFNEDHRLILDALRRKGTGDLHDLVVENINKGRQLMALSLEGKSNMGRVKIAAFKSGPSNAHMAKGGTARGKGA
jgi:DNA-binding GntR family transcriptional regulator